MSSERSQDEAAAHEEAGSVRAGRPAGEDAPGGAAAQPMRRLCAVMLSLQAVVTVLAIPVAVSVSHTDGRTAGIAGGGLALLGLVIAGLLRFRWAYYAGTFLQFLVIATGIVVPAMFFLGFVFAVLWFVAIWMGRQAEIARSR